MKHWHSMGIAILALAFAACAGVPVEGMLPATWNPPSGEPEQVPFSFESVGVDQTHGEMFTTLGRGGPAFRGPYVRVEQSTQGHLVTMVYDGWSAPEWQVWDHDDEGRWVSEGASYGDFAHFYTGMVVASLRSESGLAMRCHFRLNDPSRGFLEGGSGACQVSNGGRLALSF